MANTNPPLLENNLGHGVYGYTVLLSVQAFTIILCLVVCLIVKRKSQPDVLEVLGRVGL